MLSPDVPALAAVWQRRALASLWRMGVPARAGRLRRSAAAVTLTVVPNYPEHVPAVLRSAPALQAALGVPRPLTVRQSGRAVLVDVPLPERLTRAPTLASIPPGSGLAVPIGHGLDGRPVVIDLANPATCHGLVTGSTGSGKSNALRTMLRQLTVGAADGLQVVLVDPDGRTFAGMGPVAVDPVDVLQALRWTAAEVERRAGGTAVTFPPVVVFVDEVQAVLRLDGARAALETISARGRKHAVHAVLAGSDISAAAVPRSVANNLRFRLAFAVADYHASMGALGQVGAERLQQPGQAILQPGGRRLTVAYAQPADLASVASSGAIVAPWAAVPEGVPEGVPEVPAGVPADGWRWLWGCVQDGGRAPGVGRIAARFKVGKARAAELQRIVGTAAAAVAGDDARADIAPNLVAVPEVRA